MTKPAYHWGLAFFAFWAAVMGYITSLLSGSESSRTTILVAPWFALFVLSLNLFLYLGKLTKRINELETRCGLTSTLS